MNKVIDRILLALTILTVFGSITSIVKTKNMDDRFFLGFKPIYINNDATEPRLAKGSIAIVKKGEFINVKKKDLILYTDNQKLMTQEVVSNKEGEIQTRNIKEGYIYPRTATEKAYRGKVVLRMNFIAKISNLISR
jgi:hypothetical protein